MKAVRCAAPTATTAMRRAERAGCFVVTVTGDMVRVTTPDGTLRCNVSLRSKEAPATLLRLLRACERDGQ